jgi:hypothetical protein
MSSARVVATGVLAAVSAVAACGNGRTSDKELGSLVIKPDDTIKPIDLAKAVKDPGELGRAVALPHREVERLLGPHVTTFRSATVVTEGANQVDALTVDTTIELGEAGAWHALSNNSADYGREAIWSGGALYLRPRYARWHKRAPNDKHEPAALRDEYAGEIAAVWDLLAPGVELFDRGNRTVAGRNGRVVEIKLSPSPRKPPAEPLTQRKWRETRIVEAVAGEIVLDAEHGVPLAAKLTGKLVYVRDGRKFQWTLDASEDVRDIGTAVAIATPDPADVVATPERKREVEDRNALLDGIAPPIGARADDGAVPVAPGAGSGSGAAKP